MLSSTTISVRDHANGESIALSCVPEVCLLLRKCLRMAKSSFPPAPARKWRVIVSRRVVAGGAIMARHRPFYKQLAFSSGLLSLSIAFAACAGSLATPMSGTWTGLIQDSVLGEGML